MPSVGGYKHRSGCRGINILRAYSDAARTTVSHQPKLTPARFMLLGCLVNCRRPVSPVIYRRRGGNIVPRILPVGGKLLFDIGLRKQNPTSETHTTVHLSNMINYFTSLETIVVIFIVTEYKCSSRKHDITTAHRRHHTQYQINSDHTRNPGTRQTILCRKRPDAVRRRERYVGGVDALMPTMLQVSVSSTTKSPTVRLRSTSA